jgi:hypothetical protein
MYLKRCVILSEGPGASDMFRDEAILVPPGDPDALCSAILKAWHDEEYRRGFEDRGHAYALSLGGERELIERIILSAATWLESECAHTPSGRSTL